MSTFSDSVDQDGGQQRKYNKGHNNIENQCQNKTWNKNVHHKWINTRASHRQRHLKINVAMAQKGTMRNRTTTTYYAMPLKYNVSKNFLNGSV